MTFLLTRVFSALIVVFWVATAVFFLIHLVPGDPVDYILGETALDADREALRQRLGLDQSMMVQYVSFLKGIITWDFGKSFYYDMQVTSIIAQRLPATIELAIASLLVACLFAFPLGIIAAVKKGTYVDRAAMSFSLLGVSIPNFWLGPVLILVFSLWMGWLPVSGRDGWLSLVLPAFTLGTALAAILSRMIRSSMLEVLNEDYIRTARAKGLSEFRVIVKHALRNALLPVTTVLGLQLGGLLGGAVITETVFAWPGLGKEIIDAIMSRDYPLVQASVLLVSIFYVSVNLMIDIAYTLIDPRIRHQE